MSETVWLVAVNPGRPAYPIEPISPFMNDWPIRTRVRDCLPLLDCGQPVKLHTTWAGVERARRIVAEVAG